MSMCNSDIQNTFNNVRCLKCEGTKILVCKECCGMGSIEVDQSPDINFKERIVDQLELTVFCVTCSCCCEPGTALAEGKGGSRTVPCYCRTGIQFVDSFTSEDRWFEAGDGICIYRCGSS